MIKWENIQGKFEKCLPAAKTIPLTANKAQFTVK